MNENWVRWLTASIAVYFKTVTDTLNLPLLCDGLDEREHANIHHNHAELRIGGPFLNELSKNYWRVHVDINILLTYLMAANEDSVYDLQTWAGVIQEAFDGPINIYKYGSESGDDESYVGCLRPRKGKNEENRVLTFGQISKVDRLRQSMIDGRFIMEISV